MFFVVLLSYDILGLLFRAYSINSVYERVIRCWALKAIKRLLVNGNQMKSDKVIGKIM